MVVVLALFSTYKNTLFVGSKQIQTYRNVQLSIFSYLPFLFLVHKINIFIVHIFFSYNFLPFHQLFSSTYHYPVFLFHLPIPPRHRHITTQMTFDVVYFHPPSPSTRPFFVLCQYASAENPRPPPSKSRNSYKNSIYSSFDFLTSLTFPFAYYRVVPQRCVCTLLHSFFPI